MHRRVFSEDRPLFGELLRRARRKACRGEIRFVAVETPRVVQEGAARLGKRLQAAGADVRWVDVQNLHFTLNFLGDVVAERIPEICQAVAKAADGLCSIVEAVERDAPRAFGAHALRTGLVALAGATRLPASVLPLPRPPAESGAR